MGISSGPPEVTVIAPVYRNAETLEDLTGQLRQALAPLVRDFEVLFVNDASPDHSAVVLKRLAAEHRFVSVIDLERNIGQHEAIFAGLRQAAGSSVVVMDADLQDPPEAIGAMYERLRSGHCEAVFAARVGRYQSLPRMMGSWLYRALLRILTGVPSGAGGYVIMTRKLVERLLEFDCERRYLVGMIGCTGLPVSSIPVERRFRAAGGSAYSAMQRIRVASSNLICVWQCRWSQWTRHKQA